jgi:hypothetical protein
MLCSGVQGGARTPPQVDKSAIRSEHDKKNTINVAQLLQQGVFKLQPGKVRGWMCVVHHKQQLRK